MSKVYIGLGSNKGERKEFLQHALTEIENNSGLSILDISSIYETKPYGVTEQPNYLNAVLLIETEYSLLEIYHKVKKIEKIVGRIESKRWGPREIDLDIILYDSMIYRDELIEIPHKEYSKRDFVLVPLLEISPDIIDPITNESVKIFLEKLDQEFIIDKMENNFKERIGEEIA